MKQHTLQPKLRFPEFEEDWKKEFIKNISDFIGGGTPDTSKSEFWQGNIPWISSSDIFENEISKISLTRFINLDALNNSATKLIPKGSLLIVSRVGVGKFAIAPTDICTSQDFTNLILKKDEVNNAFLAYQLFANKNVLLKISQGTSIKGFTSSDLKSVLVQLPSLPEQQKIADYLSTIDAKINLLEEKKTELSRYKKAMMQKLFSQEIRFKPSEAEALEAYPEWEEKRLGEIGFFQTSSIDKLSRENEKEVFLINYMNVYRHEKIDKLSINNYQKVTAKDAQIISCNIKKGDILFTPSSETPSDIGHSVVIFEDIENAVFSYHLMRFRPNIKLDLKYSHYFCNIPKVLDQLTKYATGSTRFTISVKSFSNVNVDIPCYEEQQKIAEFLSAIDESIDKVSEQITQTQSFKKAMLQQMFV